MNNIIKFTDKISKHNSNVYVFTGDDLEIFKIYVRNKKTFTMKINNFYNLKKKLLDLIILYKDISLVLNKKYNKKTQHLLNNTRDLILKNIINNQYGLNNVINDNFNYTTSLIRPIEEVIIDFKNTQHSDNQDNLHYSLPEAPNKPICIYESILPKAPGM